MEIEVVQLFEAAKKAADAANVESPNNADICRCIDSLKQLKAIPVNSELLVSTQVGKRLRSLTKHPTKAIEAMASELLDVWKKVVVEEAAKKKRSVLEKKNHEKSEVLKSSTMKIEKRSKSSSTVVKETDIVEVEKIVTIESNIKEDQTNFNHNEVPPPKLTSLVKCNNDLRDKIRELLVEALSKVANEVEDDLKEAVKERDPFRVAVAVETVMFEKLGLSNGSQKIKYRSIMFNMKDPKNPDLRRKVLLGVVKPEELATMTAEEMASEKRQMENKQIKEKALFDCERGGPPKATTDQFRCGRCGQRKTTYYQMQTRSADEPMTTYVTCVNCNNHWKFC